MAHEPVIGVTRCSRLDDYVASVERSGARARVLEVSESPRTVLETIDGVLLTGGGDVDPAFYGENRHETVEDAEPGRDEFELDLARRAMEDDVPVLAICRGAQVLNVAAGGTLVQDIPTAVTTELTHSLTEPKNCVAHDITVDVDSRLHSALGAAVSAACACRVNSRHHQSVGKLGRNLKASAMAPDGVIEGIEAPDAAFCLGVQWHPENFWRTGEFKPLFDAFVAAARDRMEAKL
ncbi:MAG TPA: gamma-glutamyl-gamma-aminobutyrate hydrolase family protein [Vicinamibacterales bacterium]|jgi:putative glutamine amidotransferase|nr:gamma-glutamyl-gamma-aminobutyrate hydrolase family protein [Vicinamibacterales bacterium]